MNEARIRIALIGAGVAAAVLVYFAFNPLRVSFFPRCPFNVLTGLYCPGCGSQRAFHALLHGRLREAAGYNLLAVIALPFLLYSAAVFTANHLFGRSWRQELFYKPWFARLVFGVVIVFWVLRNLPYPCFRWMAP